MRSKHVVLLALAGLSALLGFTPLACQALQPESAPAFLRIAPTQSRPKIIGGEHLDGLPAVGALTQDGQPFCSGALIAPRRVLTAAHCLEDSAPWLLRFVIGPDAHKPETELGVLATEMHPDYDPDSLRADLGLVHLAQDAPVEPLELALFMDASWLGVELLFVGYGMDASYDLDSVGHKRAVRMPVEELGERDFSFGGYDANICDGDSGSPALLERSDGSALVAGVISAGDTWCEEFGIATRVDAFAEFVLRVEPEGCGDETYFGRCEDETLIWCDEGELRRRDCREFDAYCTLYSLEDGYFCVE